MPQLCEEYVSNSVTNPTSLSAVSEVVACWMEPCRSSTRTTGQTMCMYWRWRRGVQILWFNLSGLESWPPFRASRLKQQASVLLGSLKKPLSIPNDPMLLASCCQTLTAARGWCLLAEHERMIDEPTVEVNVPVCYYGFLQKKLGSKKALDNSSKVIIFVCGGNDISNRNVSDLAKHHVGWREKDGWGP